MRIKRLQLKNFRNYPELDLTFGPGVNVLSGDNGQGKTNVLEAIYLCSCARSHRTARDLELIRQGESSYEIDLLYDDNDYLDQSIRLDYLAAVPGLENRKISTRSFWHNGIKQDRIADLYGLFNAVIFAPEDLQLIKEGPQTRRRFMDLLMSQVKPAYFGALQTFNRVLSQRNRLLKTLREANLSESNPDYIFAKTQIDVWNDQFAEAAAQLIAWRFQLADKIKSYASEYQLSISSGKEKLDIRYRTLSVLKEEMAVEEIAAHIVKRLETTVQDDIFRGNTGIGPHRDDLELKINGEVLRVYGSQGQQRTSVLALKLAELRFVKEITGETPVLLLDDVMSELDMKRRASLVEALQDSQVFITCTDTENILKELSALSGSESITYFNVKAGEIVNVEAPEQA